MTRKPFKSTYRKHLLGLVSILLVFALSVYVVFVDYTTEYNWYYPLDKPVVIGTHYLKLERRVFLVNLRTGETSPIECTGFGVVGLKLPASNSSYAVVNHKGLNTYVIALVLAVLIIHVFSLILLLKHEKKITLLSIIVYALVILCSLLTLSTLLNYVELGRESDYMVKSQVISESLELVSPEEIEREGIGNVKPVLDLLEYVYGSVYVYKCLPEEVQVTTLVRAEIKNPLRYAAPFIPIIVLGNHVELSYEKTGYVTEGSVQCYAITIARINATYTIHKVEFKRHENPVKQLFSLLPPILLISQTGLILALRNILETSRNQK